MIDLSAFVKRSMEAAQDLAEAVSLGGPPKPPPPAPGPPGGAPGLPGATTVPPQPQGSPGALQSAAARPPNGGVTPTSPLQMMPAFKSPTFASMLQGEVGRQGPVGFAQGGRVQRDLAVGGPVFDFSCR